MLNTEDKLAWCEKFGVSAELGFTLSRMHELEIGAYLNPQKVKDIYTHDLFAVFQSDLKTVRTPLFKSKELYGIDPQYAVTFNLKDAERYKSLYPNIVVLFDVKWDRDNCEKQIGNSVYSVRPMHATYAGFLKDIANAIEKSGGHKIEYARRKDDTSGNAKESYVFDIRHLHKLRSSVQ